jgi:hypothetical protein
MKFLTIGPAAAAQPYSRGVKPALATWLVLLALVVAACGATAPPTARPAGPTHDLHAWPELEEQIPDEISGRRVTKVSLAAHPDRQDAKTLAVLQQLGRSVSDLQLANAELSGTDLTIGAMRIVGAEGSAIVAAFEQIDADDPNSQAVYTDVNFGDKQVTARTVGETTAYLYGTQDIMFIVAGERDLVEAALKQLR